MRRGSRFLSDCVVREFPQTPGPCEVDMSEEKQEINDEAGGLTSREEKLAREKEQILLRVADARLDTLTTQVAWLLNHYPETRDSDVTLQIQYWKTFEADQFKAGNISVSDLYKLKRLTSIARSRATIQNTHKLFLASEEVRKHRGTLEEKERDKQIRAAGSRPTYTVYADESGKTSTYLIVGSLWLLNGIESRNIAVDLANWRSESAFKEEIHFSRISNTNIERYYEILDILYTRSAAISFKAIKLLRSGLSNQRSALDDMFYHLVVRGIQHEHSSGRAPLPRNFQLWKDAEGESNDKLFIANLSDKLRKASTTFFLGELFISDIFAIDSKKSELVQLADLFTASVNRIVNSTGTGGHVKDKFAEALLSKFSLDDHPDSNDELGNVVFIDDV